MKAKLPPLPAVVIDTREQLPYTFDRILTRKGGAVVASVGTLSSGDYSLVGHTSDVAIERKSLADLYSTLTSGRDRFRREMERLSECAFAAVVVEAGWDAILTKPGLRSQANPRSIVGTIFSWSVRYPVKWFTFPSREFAEVGTLRMLEFYHEQHIEEQLLKVVESEKTHGET